MSSPTNPGDYTSLGFKEIITRLDGAVLILTINRPKQRNSWNKTLPWELLKTFEIADKDDRVRVIVVTADPSAPAYCSGADISQGWKLFAEDEKDTEHRDTGGMVSMAIYRCRKITIAAVNGHAAGVGMTAMQLPFDFRFVWESAKLTFPFVRRGIVPEATSTYLLPRLLGHSRATSLLLSGSTLSPTSPLLQPLYHTILPTRTDVLPAALTFAHELATHTSQVSVAYTKGLIQNPGGSIEENHLLDSRGMATLGKSRDAEEGVKSFREKREPKFKDRLGEVEGEWYPWWKTVDVSVKSKSKL
ncbi:ClpP/crotonase [Dendrothele bispora CBS 962.96]|uniref:ClpP/crotonase n=1 Tax=Dendrothele bispora (strain CBS 962.96) TaxID=1314807 RepID=A0A4S8MKL3_DENBC|nr:ClpP/crotonase [Dendrothele bispora CBS 962.96]